MTMALAQSAHMRVGTSEVLKVARDKAGELRKLYQRGADPLAERRAAVPRVETSINPE
jgi:hypothetical protein